VIFFQLGFAFIIPEWLQRLNMPYNDLKNMWPLNYYFFDEWNVNALLNSGNLGVWMIIWGIALIFIVSPVLTYFYGKRWYCSWVCGCGGLAETAGDSFRHLSDKSINAWKLERWMVHSVLVLVLVMTIGVIYSYLPSDPNQYWINRLSFLWIILMISVVALVTIFFKRNAWFTKYQQIVFRISCGILILISLWAGFTIYLGATDFFPIDPYLLRSWYGFYIGALFSGVIGVGFYPIFGNRVWCRFGCPMAAILGLQQKWFSRFRITTNGGQCISCGNCSTYCEMGIDVKSYAQRGQDIVRASCVGCGICSSVCPRGVLKLENGSLKSKQDAQFSLFNEDNDFHQ
jgi:polyferredoxin